MPQALSYPHKVQPLLKLSLCGPRTHCSLKVTLETSTQLSAHLEHPITAISMDLSYINQYLMPDWLCPVLCSIYVS